MAATVSGEAVGPLAEEAAKLLAAVQDWARSRMGEHDASGEHLASEECRLCPICQGIALARQVKPETMEHLLAAVGSLAAAVRSTVGAPPAPPDGSRVQRIDIREG